MILELSASLADELSRTLEQVLGDMSLEIADTDNPRYRRHLEARRDRLRSVQQCLGPAVSRHGRSALNPPDRP